MSCLLPIKILFVGSQFKVVLGNAKIDVGIADEGKLRFRFYAIVGVKDELELLLIDQG